MYPKNQQDQATHGVDLLVGATLEAPGSFGSIADNTVVKPPISTGPVTIFASGGTYLGSALPTTSGPGTGAQNVQTGAYYQITTDGAGAPATITVVKTRPDGTINGAAVGAPTNPGAGPNIAVTGQTIVFDAASLNTAFKTSNITGNVTVTLQAGDIQFPYSGSTGNNDGIYEAENGACGLYVGTTGNVKVEMANAPENVAITIPNVQNGTTLPILVRKVYIDGAATTATNLVALY